MRKMFLLYKTTRLWLLSLAVKSSNYNYYTSYVYYFKKMGFGPTQTICVRIYFWTKL